MSEEQDILNALANAIKNLDMKIQMQGKEIASLKLKKQELPTYFGTKEQIIEELEKQGYFRKEQPGLQDDFDNAFRLFTQTNQFGDLIAGLVNEVGQPASLMEIYRTMDLRGVVWNYGIGWLSALKGGWNSAIASAKRDADDKIKFVEENVRAITPKEALDYFNGSDELENYYRDREKIKELKRKEVFRSFGYELIKNPQTNEEMLIPIKPSKQKAVFYVWRKDKSGRRRKVKVGEIESTSPLDTYNWPCEVSVLGNKMLSGISKTDYIFNEKSGGENKMSEEPVYLKFNKDGSTEIPLKDKFKINKIEKTREVYE